MMRPTRATSPMATYQAHTASPPPPEPNSSRLTSFKSTSFDSPANNVGLWPTNVGSPRTRSHRSIPVPPTPAGASGLPPTASSPTPASAAEAVLRVWHWHLDGGASRLIPQGRLDGQVAGGQGVGDDQQVGLTGREAGLGRGNRLPVQGVDDRPGHLIVQFHGGLIGVETGGMEILVASRQVP